MNKIKCNKNKKTKPKNRKYRRVGNNRQPQQLSTQSLDLFGEIKYTTVDNFYRFDNSTVLNIKTRITNSPEFPLLNMYTTRMKIEKVDILITKNNTVEELYPTAKLALYNTNNVVDDDQIRLNNYPIIDFNNDQPQRIVVHINPNKLLSPDETGYVPPVGLPELDIKVLALRTGANTNKVVANYHIKVVMRYYKMDNALAINKQPIKSVVKSKEQDEEIDWYTDPSDDEEIGDQLQSNSNTLTTEYLELKKQVNKLMTAVKVLEQSIPKNREKKKTQ